MNTFDGYIRRNGTNSKVLLDGGNAKALSEFIGTISYANNKITYTKADGTSYDLINLSNYIYNLGAATSDNLGGIKIGFSQSGKNYPVQLDANNKAYVYVPWEENSHYTTRLYVGDGTAENKITTNGNTRITVTDNNNVRNYITLIGSGATNISSDDNGKITINSTNTTYNTGDSATLNKGTNTEGKLWSAKTLVDYISDILGVDSTAITSLNTLIGLLHDNDTATGILVELAKKLNTPSSSIGSNNQPIYWNGSSFTTIGYTIEKSVPSNAIFTDTKYSFYVGENNNIKEHKNVSNPYFKLFENNTPTSIQIKAGTGISISSDTNGNITITNSSPDQNHNTDKTGIKLGTISGTKKTDSTVIINNSSTGLTIAGGTNKFSIGDGTNYIEIPITPSFTVSNKDSTIGTSLTTIATIAGTDIKAKIDSYLPLSGGIMTGHLTIKTSSYRDLLTIYRNENNNNSVINFSNKDGFLGAIGFTGLLQAGMPEKPHVVLKDGTLYTLLHSGNTSISNGTITINGTSITPITSLSNYPTKLETVLDVGGAITNTIYSLGAKRVFSGHNVTDAPVQGWVSGLVLGSNWNNNHYLHYLVEADDRWYTTRYYENSKMKSWNTFAYLSDIPTKVSLLTNDSGYLTSHLNLPDMIKRHDTENLFNDTAGLRVITVADDLTLFGPEKKLGSVIQWSNANYSPSTVNSKNWYNQLMGLTDDRLYFRTRTNGGNWTNFHKVAWISDIPTKSSWNYDDRYLKLSTGGTVLGTTTFKTNSYGTQLEIYINTNNGNPSIKFNNPNCITNRYIGFETNRNGDNALYFTDNNATNKYYVASEEYVTSRGYLTRYGNYIGYRHIEAGPSSYWSDSYLYIGYGLSPTTPTKLIRFYYSEVINNAISRKEVAQIGTDGLSLLNNRIWIKSAAETGGTTNRLELTSGLPSGYGLNKKGTLIYSNGIAFLDPYNTSNNDGAWIRHIETTGNQGTLEIAVGNDATNEDIHFRWYNTSNLIAKDIVVPRNSGTIALTSDLSNYLTINTNQTVTGAKTFNNGKWIIAASENNEITTEHFANSKYYNNANTAVIGIDWSITNALKFRWYSDYWLIGNIRSGNTNTAGFGIALRDNTNNRQIDCFRVTKEESYIKGYVALHKGNSSVSKSGETLTVNIGGTSYSLTNTNTWRGITDSYSGTDSTISLSLKGGNDLYNTLLNGYANSAGYANYLNLVFSNEIRFNNKPSSSIDVYFNYLWAGGIADDKINNYRFLNGNRGYAGIVAEQLSCTNGYIYLHGPGSNTYNMSSIFSNSAGLTIKTPRATNALNGTVLPLMIKTRGGQWSELQTGTIVANGNITATAFYASSDLRLKNILTYPNYSAKQLASLPLVKYTWKDKENDSIHLGSIALDVERIIPEVVNIDNEGYKSLDYATLSAIGVISLAREIVELKKEIKELKSKLYG